MTTLEVSLLCFIIGFVIDPYIDVILVILNKAWLKHKKKKEEKDHCNNCGK